jgi:hypothetical protein
VVLKMVFTQARSWPFERITAGRHCCIYLLVLSEGQAEDVDLPPEKKLITRDPIKNNL